MPYQATVLPRIPQASPRFPNRLPYPRQQVVQAGCQVFTQHPYVGGRPQIRPCTPSPPVMPLSAPQSTSQSIRPLAQNRQQSKMLGLPLMLPYKKDKLSDSKFRIDKGKQQSNMQASPSLIVITPAVSNPSATVTVTLPSAITRVSNSEKDTCPAVNASADHTLGGPSANNASDGPSTNQALGGPTAPKRRRARKTIHTVKPVPEDTENINEKADQQKVPGKRNARKGARQPVEASKSQAEFTITTLDPKPLDTGNTDEQAQDNQPKVKKIVIKRSLFTDIIPDPAKTNSSQQKDDAKGDSKGDDATDTAEKSAESQGFLTAKSSEDPEQEKDLPDKQASSVFTTSTPAPASKGKTILSPELRNTTATMIMPCSTSTGEGFVMPKEPTCSPTTSTTDVLKPAPKRKNRARKSIQGRLPDDVLQGSLSTAEETEMHGVNISSVKETEKGRIYAKTEEKHSISAVINEPSVSSTKKDEKERADVKKTSRSSSVKKDRKEHRSTSRESSSSRNSGAKKERSHSANSDSRSRSVKTDASRSSSPKKDSKEIGSTKKKRESSSGHKEEKGSNSLKKDKKESSSKKERGSSSSRKEGKKNSDSKDKEKRSSSKKDEKRSSSTKKDEKSRSDKKEETEGQEIDKDTTKNLEKYATEIQTHSEYLADTGSEIYGKLPEKSSEVECGKLPEKSSEVECGKLPEKKYEVECGKLPEKSSEVECGKFLENEGEVGCGKLLEKRSEVECGKLLEQSSENPIEDYHAYSSNSTLNCSLDLEGNEFCRESPTAKQETSRSGRKIKRRFSFEPDSEFVSPHKARSSKDGLNKHRNIAGVTDCIVLSDSASDTANTENSEKQSPAKPTDVMKKTGENPSVKKARPKKPKRRSPKPGPKSLTKVPLLEKQPENVIVELNIKEVETHCVPLANPEESTAQASVSAEQIESLSPKLKLKEGQASDTEVKSNSSPPLQEASVQLDLQGNLQGHSIFS